MTCNVFLSPDKCWINRKQIFSYVSNKLVIARLSRTIWPIFSLLLIFCFYFTHLKAHEISCQKMRDPENICHIVIGTVRKLMHIPEIYIRNIIYIYMYIYNIYMYIYIYLYIYIYIYIYIIQQWSYKKFTSDVMIAPYHTVFYFDVVINLLHLGCCILEKS